MKKSKINKKDIQNYIGPELETMRAFLINFHLNNSLKILSFLRQMMDFELTNRDTNCHKKDS